MTGASWSVFTSDTWLALIIILAITHSAAPRQTVQTEPRTVRVIPIARCISAVIPKSPVPCVSCCIDRYGSLESNSLSVTDDEDGR